MYDLLSEQIISVRTDDGIRSCSIPEIFELLEANAVVCFPALQAHQEHSWHAFFVQLALMTPEEGAILTWEERLLGLAPRVAWNLMVDDLNQPAFMQPPVPEGHLDKWEPVLSPEGMDTLVMAKNHDVKMNRMVNPELEHWVFALVNAQTMQSYSGRGNFGIHRMNGGFGSRPFIAKSNSRRPGVRFQEDVRAIKASRGTMFTPDNTLYKLEGGIQLLWLEPWDGNSSLERSDLDPYFIEVSRRLRFHKGGLHRRSTKERRVSVPQTSNGDDLSYEDPWTPVATEDGKPLTVKSFPYKKVSSIFLLGEYKPSPTMKNGTLLLMSNLVGGQGKTEGFFERTLIMPPKVLSMFNSNKDVFGNRSAEMIADVAVICGLLRNALTGLYNPLKPNERNERDLRPDKASAELDRRVDEKFFEFLWEGIDPANQSMFKARWLLFLREEAENILTEAAQSTSTSSASKYKAQAIMWNKFRGSFWNKFGEYIPKPSTEKKDEQDLC